MSRVERLNQKYNDSKQITKLIETIFSSHPGGIYFDEYEKLTMEVCSDLFFCIYDCIY